MRDAVIVLVWFVVAGIVAAVAWWRLVDLPQATREGGSVVIQADQLGKQVNIDGWFFVIALVGGLVSGHRAAVHARARPAADGRAGHAGWWHRLVR